MKNYAKARTLLGISLFLTEFSIFVLAAKLLKIPETQILPLAVPYFMLLACVNHFHFGSILIWHEILALIRANLVYTGLWGITALYLGRDLLQPFVLTGFLFFVTVAVARMFRLMAGTYLGIRILVLGSGESAEEAHTLFRRNRFLFINPLAYVSLASVTGTPDSPEIRKTARIISLQDADAFIRTHSVEEIYIADNRLSAAQLEALTRQFRDKVPVIRSKPASKASLPGFGEIASYDSQIFEVLTDTRRSRLCGILGRTLDILVGLAGCLVLIPVTLAVKIGALRSGDTGPIFFSQERFGKDGKLIRIYKYRTMVPDAEKILREMMATDPRIREEYRVHKKLDPDPRITPFGNLLRRTSLDELPQLINILKGEMSIIGPRPYLPGEKEDMGPLFDVIVKLKPGLTGIWQASGRNNIGFAERCKMDEYYYYHRSARMDLIILVKTVKTVLLGEGVR